jgi:hypothetical protein
MGLATHLGPWLLGTVKNTIGTGLGQTRNTGSTNISQTVKKDFTGAVFGAATNVTIGTIPAGAQIIDIKVDTITAFTGSTAANMTIGTAASAALFFAATDITTQGRLALTGAATKLGAWAGAATTASPNGAGVGATDVTVIAAITPTIANVTAGLVQFTIIYAMANSDGTQYPAVTAQ